MGVMGKAFKDRSNERFPDVLHVHLFEHDEGQGGQRGEERRHEDHHDAHGDAFVQAGQS